MSSITANSGYRFEKYAGNDTCVILPDMVDSRPLTIIGTKAFLSCRSVERLVLPNTLEQVEDWAFAHMKGLKEIVFPARKIRFGKKVFLGCTNLQRIVFAKTEGLYEGLPYFMASAATLMEAPLQAELAGDKDGQWKWLEEYDRLLEQYLERPDTYGFEPAFIGWFNVEDVDDQQEDYVREQKRKKAGLTFQRLLYSVGMTEKLRGKLADYLLGKRDGSVPDLVLELFENFGRNNGNPVCYLKIWQEIGGFEIYSPRFLLEKLPDADPEVRAFLMECCLRKEAEHDFFKDMEL